MPGFEPTVSLVSDDARGQIYVVNLPGDRELLLLHSVKGTLRGGHSHDVDEVVTMLSGAMLYHKLVDGREQTQPLTVTVSKTSDGQDDYLQILSADSFSVNIVLISSKITVQDVR